MAKFLKTTGVSHYLEELIKKTKERLILISPYLQFNDRIKEQLEYLVKQKKDIFIVFRENKLNEGDKTWLENHKKIGTLLNQNLHAKCYINESEGIITSMNLYAFSKENNNEMGVYFLKTEDQVLYSDALQEAEWLLNISHTLNLTSSKTDFAYNKPEIKRQDSPKPKSLSKHYGYCIRTGVEIDFDIDRPFSPNAYKEWAKRKDEDYPENFCHFSGEHSDGETSFAYPILKKNWKKASDIFDLDY